MKKLFFLASVVLFLTVGLTGCFEKMQNSLKALGKPKYMVVDLLTGGVSYMDIEPAGGWSDIHKTTKLVLRRIEPGTFTMGSLKSEQGHLSEVAERVARIFMGNTESEIGNQSNETQHEVTLTRPFYIGVFEITQKQYQLITGGNPSVMKFRGDTKPVDNVSYYDIRGAQKGAQWPANNEVDEYSFFGKLRARTKLNFDLPTEAQWEYACRAGTTTALNNGTNLSDEDRDYNLDKLGRYRFNGDFDHETSEYRGHAFVGSYVPNFWDLYDMHGNVWEWCLDWYDEYSAEAATDPRGPDVGVHRVLRGGSWIGIAFSCRSANRYSAHPSGSGQGIGGFRVVLVQ